MSLCRHSALSLFNEVFQKWMVRDQLAIECHRVGIAIVEADRQRLWYRLCGVVHCGEELLPLIAISLEDDPDCDVAPLQDAIAIRLHREGNALPSMDSI